MSRQYLAHHGYGSDEGVTRCVCGERMRSLGMLRLHIIERRFDDKPHGFVNDDQRIEIDERTRRRLKRRKGEVK